MSYKEAKHEELGITSSDIGNEFSREKLLEWKSKIDEDVRMMAINIEEAKARAQRSGEYSDPDWFHSIRTKKRYYGLLAQKIQNQLSVAKQRSAARFENKFMDICARELDLQTFEHLKALTYAEME